MAGEVLVIPKQMEVIEYETYKTGAGLGPNPGKRKTDKEECVYVTHTYF